MAKRPVRVDAKGHLQPALQEAAKIPSVDGERVSWESSKLERATFEIIYSLKFTPDIEDHMKDGAIWHSLNACAKDRDFSSKNFIRSIREFVSDQLNRSSDKLMVISQVNCDFELKRKISIHTPEGKISLSPRLNRKSASIISKMAPPDRRKLGIIDGFHFLSGAIESNNDRSAIDLSYRQIKLALGIANLHSHGYGVNRRFGFPNAPIGKFLTGSTIFNINHNQKRIGMYFTENHYPGSWKNSFTVTRSDGIKSLTNFSKKAYKKISKLEFRDTIYQAIILLQEGLESNYVDVALLKFWTGIELICSSDNREPYDVIIKRASSIFLDRTHTEMRLNFIQGFRNQMVHRGDVGGHSLLCAQWGSIYLASLIEFAAFNKYKLGRRDHFIRFLSAPLDPIILSDRINIYRKRLRMTKTTPQ